MLSWPTAVFLSRHLSRWPAVLALWGCFASLSSARADEGNVGLDLSQTLSGILAYTRWPVQPQPLRLCVTGTGPRVDALLQQGLPRSTPPDATVIVHVPDAAIATECDALYVGQLGVDSWQAMLPSLRGRAVLTLCERSVPCTAGGMVRLDLDEASGRARFEINLDAVARGDVRIHPQVLKLGRRAPTPQTP
jgi:hypothetical protein